MAELQWLGNLPSDKNVDVPYLANALKEGISGYQQQKKYNQERSDKQFEQSIQQSAMDIKQKELEQNYSKLDYDKKKEIYDTMVKLLPNLPLDKQKEMTSSPEWTTLESSLGIPSIAGASVEKESDMTWAQQQSDASIRADIQRGRGSISTLVGEPLDFTIDSKDKALDYISKKGRNPADFAEELSKYDNSPTSTASSTSDKMGKQQYKKGQTIKKNGKVYTYNGDGTWSY